MSVAKVSVVVFGICSCGAPNVEVVEDNPLGIASVEITQESAGDGSRLAVRGLDASGQEVATLSVRSGMIDFAYDESDQRESTIGRDVSVALADGWSVATMFPGRTTQELRVPDPLGPFVRLAAVKREASAVGVRLTTEPPHPSETGYAYFGAACDSDTRFWSTNASNNTPSGSTCAYDWWDTESVPYEAWQCTMTSQLHLRIIGYEACANDRAGTDHACGTGSPNGQCAYGPCQGLAAYVWATHDSPAGNPNCSVGYQSNGADWDYTSGSTQYCSGNGCSSGNGAKASAGCSYTSCCYDSTTGRGCAYVGACPANPSC